MGTQLHFKDRVCNHRSGARVRIQWKVTQDEILKLQKSGHFPDELVKIEGGQIRSVSSQTNKYILRV
jgi:hypothetical protein